MRNKFLVLAAVGFGIVFASHPLEAKAETYYARCNMKVLDKGNYVTWENWRTDAKQRNIAVGTKLTGDGTTMTEPNGGTFTMKVGDGAQFLAKFVSKSPVSVGGGAHAGDIKSGVPRVGMTKEQVYMALCAPMYIDGKNSTKGMTYDEIMKGSQWIWKKGTFTTNIGVRFDAAGKATEVAGVYR
ncbi:MAG: hypothetical protein HY884_03200 [Deltaproteobacteria bacterium]|nr:hypothetical protein [Deltaproteobacteria bacterium]